jgi:hypothetical protein
MMKRTVLTACALFALTATATADDEKANEIGSMIGSMWGDAGIRHGDPPSDETLDEARKIGVKECREFVADAAKKKKAAILYDSYGHPDAKPVGKLFSVPADKLGWFCDHYAMQLEVYALRSVAEDAKSASGWVAEGLNEEAKKNIRGNGDGYRRQAKECRDMVAKVTTFPGGADIVVKKRNGDPIGKVSEVAAMCEALDKAAEIYDAEWKVASKTFEKPFVEAGFTADKLEYLVYYGPEIDGWYVKGCKEPKNLKALKKANAWFQWFTDSDGIITIRKYWWKGDKLVKTTEKQFVTEAKAYKIGCK